MRSARVAGVRFLPAADSEHAAMSHRRLAASTLIVSAAVLAAPALGQSVTQPELPVQPLESVALITVDAPDFAALEREDAQRDAEGLAPRYAVPHEVEVTPWTHGTWEDLDAGTLLWRLRIQAPSARSINLGFGEYALPEGAALVLYSADRTHVVRPFTAADNEEHGALWTPVVGTDELVVELALPTAVVGELRLTLTHIGYGYRGFGTGTSGSGPLMRSGSCNVDVICPEGDPWRLEIPSVGVISTGGSTFCTGFLVNNVRGDQKPYFMTANHCGVRANNAASLVVYWNYENSTCRAPGSASSGGNGNGTLNQFNTGSFFRSTYSGSDFTLVELDDDPDPAFLVSFAGWDNSGNDLSSAIAIHHPNTDEKRISFEDDPTTTTTYLQNAVPGNGTHIRVTDWDLGTTEPGSSGSPLFDPAHRIVGQLHGGFASCSSQTSDWYGKFSVSWNGGGTSASRLRDWLDPDGTGAVVVDTIPSSGVRGKVVRYGPEIGGVNIGRLNSMSVPTIGQSMSIEVSNFANSASVLILFSPTQVFQPFFGGTALVDMAQIIGRLPVALTGGAGSVTAPIPNDTGLVNLTVYGQAGGLDPTQPNGVSLSNGLAITIGDV